MKKYTLGISGMQCGMCEAHINDTVRKAVPGAQKLSSSAAKKRTSFVCGTEVDEAALREAIARTGYTMTSFESEPYEKKKGLFSFLKK